MNITVQLAKMKRLLKKKAGEILFGKQPNRSREYMLSAGPFDLVVHVGAHTGQEVELYRTLGAQRVIWIEADPDTYARLVKNLSEAERQATRPIRHKTVCALVSDANDLTKTFHRFNNEGASSSVYPPTKRLLNEWPGLGLVGNIVELRTRTLENILEAAQIDPRPSKSLLIVDVQGHEAAVLAGIGRYACTFEICECEVSQEAIYEGGALYPDIKAIFERLGYQMVSHSEENLPWHGDIIFERRPSLGAGSSEMS